MVVIFRLFTKNMRWSFTPFSTNDFLCIFPSALFSSFWARMRLYTVSIGGENQEILFAFLGKKIEAGGELNCMSRGSECDDKAAAGK